MALSISYCDTGKNDCQRSSGAKRIVLSASTVVIFDSMHDHGRASVSLWLTNYTISMTSATLEEGYYVHIILSNEQIAYIIPDGLSMTSLKKLLSPFDTETWIAILVTVAVTFIAIQVISLTLKKLRDKCFGRAVGSPTMNLLNVLLCGGQTRIPETYTAKYIFLNFLVWKP